jgi:hypothetical protein
MTSGTEQPEQICYDIVLILAFIFVLSLNIKRLQGEIFGPSFLHQAIPLGQKKELTTRKNVLL